MAECDCKYYDAELDCCKYFSDWTQPMPVLQPCIEIFDGHFLNLQGSEDQTLVCDMKQAFLELPAADVVQVVRCKDCAVPHNRWTGCPKLNGLVTDPDFYCSYGERKKGDG